MPANDPLSRLALVLGRLPGVGKRSADRMVFALLKGQGALLKELSAALRDTEAAVITCGRCGNVTLREENPCRICSDARRDDKILCVVEDPSGISLIEQSGGFRGRYHVLNGKLSPIRGEGVRNTRIEALLDRVAREQVAEVILALNSDVESDATASFLREALAPSGTKVTRPARGIPAGSGLAYTDHETLAQALRGRQSL